MVSTAFVHIAPDVVLGRSVRTHAFGNLCGCTIGDETHIGTSVEEWHGHPPG